jgi:hypothetical protein
MWREKAEVWDLGKVGTPYYHVYTTVYDQYLVVENIKYVLII